MGCSNAAKYTASCLFNVYAVDIKGRQMLINIEREAKYKSKEREKEKRNINYKRYVLPNGL